MTGRRSSGRRGVGLHTVHCITRLLQPHLTAAANDKVIDHNSRVVTGALCRRQVVSSEVDSPVSEALSHAVLEGAAEEVCSGCERWRTSQHGLEGGTGAVTGRRDRLCTASSLVPARLTRPASPPHRPAGHTSPHTTQVNTNPASTAGLAHSLNCSCRANYQTVDIVIWKMNIYQPGRHGHWTRQFKTAYRVFKPYFEVL